MLAPLHCAIDREEHEKYLLISCPYTIVGEDKIEYVAMDIWIEQDNNMNHVLLKTHVIECAYGNTEIH